MDDDFDLPDESNTQASDARPSSSFVSELFGGGRRQPSGSNRSTLDDILQSGGSSGAAGTTRRRPVVTFQDEKEASAVAQQQEPATAAATARAPPSASLLDSLFAPSASPSRASPTPPAAARAAPAPAAAAPARAAPSAAEAPAAVGAGATAELDQLRREVSSLRYERSEDQKTIGDLRRRLDAAQEEHQKTVERMTEQHRLDTQEQERRHGRELEETRREGDKTAHILGNLREQEGSFGNLASRLDTLNFSLGQLRDTIQSAGAKGEAMEASLSSFTTDVRASLENSQSENWKRIEADRTQWENAVKAMEEELVQMRDRHTKEIVDARRWLETQRQECQAERKAFQEEQCLILDWIERKKGEIEAEKSEFLRREHDLLVRVVNERALMEHERREFQRQRDADVLRLREEAEQLEQHLAQVDSARQALQNARRELDRKAMQLNDLKDALIRYEQQMHWQQRSRGAATAK